MVREIVLDTETTGLNPLTGDRVVEIGCVELMNHLPTGRHYHQYINPEMLMPAEAFAVHGLSDEFLRDKPVFAEVVGDFLDFVGEATLVIHNASFDMGFLNAELARLSLPVLRNEVIDTIKLARQKFPGAQVNLDALCKRCGIDNSNRTLHGALLDSQLLAEVYLELLGGRQRGLTLTASESQGSGTAARIQRAARTPRPHAPCPEELAAHEEMVKKLKNPVWLAE